MPGLELFLGAYVKKNGAFIGSEKGLCPLGVDQPSGSLSLTGGKGLSRQDGG